MLLTPSCAAMADKSRWRQDSSGRLQPQLDRSGSPSEGAGLQLLPSGFSRSELSQRRNQSKTSNCLKASRLIRFTGMLGFSATQL